MSLPFLNGTVPLRLRARGGLLALTAVALLVAGSVPPAGAAQSWRIDEAHTSIAFKIEAVGFPATRGRFTRYAGRILVDFERPAKSFTGFTVESASVDLGSPAFNDFVKSPVLLNTARFPTLSFASTQVEKLDSRTARIAGNLTMLGVTRPITLTVSVEADPSAKERAVALVATGKITRSDFGMVFGIPVIDDALEITVKTRAFANE